MTRKTTTRTLTLALLPKKRLLLQVQEALFPTALCQEQVNSSQIVTQAHSICIPMLDLRNYSEDTRLQASIAIARTRTLPKAHAHPQGRTQVTSRL